MQFRHSIWYWFDASIQFSSMPSSHRKIMKVEPQFDDPSSVIVWRSIEWERGEKIYHFVVIINANEVQTNGSSTTSQQFVFHFASQHFEKMFIGLVGWLEFPVWKTNRPHKPYICSSGFWALGYMQSLSLRHKTAQEPTNNNNGEKISICDRVITPLIIIVIIVCVYCKMGKMVKGHLSTKHSLIQRGNDNDADDALSEAPTAAILLIS